MSNGRYILAGCGTQTAALGFGGTNDSSLFDYTEEYNGSSWTGGGPLNTARQGLGHSKVVGTDPAILCVWRFGPRDSRCVSLARFTLRFTLRFNSRIVEELVQCNCVSLSRARELQNRAFRVACQGVSRA